MARPRKVDAARRTRALLIRVTNEEHAAICANAQKAGLHLSGYVRRVAMDGQAVVPRDSAYGMSLAFQLRRVGVNLNQLTRIANADGEIPEELARVCGLVERILERIVRME